MLPANHLNHELVGIRWVFRGQEGSRPSVGMDGVGHDSFGMDMHKSSRKPQNKKTHLSVTD